MEPLVFRTPIAKEILLAVLGLCLMFFGLIFIYVGYDMLGSRGTLDSYMIMGCGFIFVLGSAYAVFREMTSREVLILDNEGIFVHANALANKHRVPWKDIQDFEKASQKMPVIWTWGPTHHYLVVVFVRPEKYIDPVESMGHAFNLTPKMGGKQYVFGDAYIPSVRLPMSIEEAQQKIAKYRASLGHTL